MEVLFAYTYLILFGKLAVGGLIALAVPPFFEMERGFYKSTAAVYLALAWMVALGNVYLLLAFQSDVVPGHVVGSWALFAVLFSAYVATLFVELPLLRARVYPLSVAIGLFAIAGTGWSYLPASVSSVAGVFFAIALVTGAAISGAAVTGMLLGHWYLIDTGLNLDPLQRMLGFCRICLRLELIAIAAVALLLWSWPGSPWHDGFAALAGGRYWLLVAGRVLCWLFALLLLAMIGRTLAIPQTMAATGLFYIQALVVAVGEICGHWLLFRTGLPL